jgi:hypothetical protein
LSAVAKSSQHRSPAQGGGSYRHLVYGLALESDFPLVSIGEVPDEGTETAIRLTLAPPEYFRQRAAGLTADPEDWIRHAVLDDGSVHMKIRGIFEAIVAVDGRSVTCARPDGADQGSFEANLLNFVLSTALTQQGEEPLHATVLALEEGAVALLGPSGAGKSTLAAFLIGQGARLITDDMLRLTFSEGRGYAHYGPNRLKLLDEPVQRLLPGSIAAGYFNTLSGKLMVQPEDTVGSRRTPPPLTALFWLGDEPPADSSAAGEVNTARLRGMELMRVLTSSAMNIRDYSPPRLARQLRFAERVAQTLPVHALVYPRNYELLGRVAEEIRKIVRAL